MNSQPLEKITRQLMRKHHTPGLAIAIHQNGKTIYEKGFGLRNLKQRQVMDADTLIGIGSITKSFTAFAIMILQERGKLSLDDSAASYLPVEPFQSRPEITLRHMLCHSTGIPSTDAGTLELSYPFDDYKNIYPATSREDFFAHLADAEAFIIFKPGEAFFYNNDMYTCLGFIIEALSGISFEQFIQQEILQPLQMSRAVLSQQAFDNDPANNVQTGYRFESQGDKRMAIASELPMGGHVQAPGGLYVSMKEMLNYAQCLLNGGSFNGVQLLSKESVATLCKGEISTPYGEGDDPQYALGWSIEPPTEQTPYTVVQHGGSLCTSNAFLALVPELQLAVMVAENACSGIAPALCRSAIALACGQEPEQAVEPLQIAAVIDEIVGSYSSQYNLYQLTVSRQGNILQADMDIDDGRVSFPLIPKDLNNLSFYTYSLRSKLKMAVTFYRDKNTGKVAFAAYDRYLYRRC